MKLRQLSVAHVDGFYADLRRDGQSPGSVRRIHQALRRALHMGVSWGWIPTNPAAAASPPRKPPDDEIHVPDPATVTRLIAGARQTNEDHAVYLELKAHTGARRGELCALRWSDVDLGAGELVIRRNLLYAGKQLIEKEPKGRRSRRIALDGPQVAALRAHRARMLKHALAAGEPPVDDMYVFSVELDGSQPLTPNAATQRFRRLCRRLSIDGVRLHDCSATGPPPRCSPAASTSAPSQNASATPTPPSP